MPKHVMKLHPWPEVVANVDDLIKHGVDCFQQFNCEKCGAKQTMDEKNKLFTSGICEECGHETDIVKNGCNYMVHATNPQASMHVLKKMAGDKS